MSNAPFDQVLANNAQAVDHCMKLGAVIIKPPSQMQTGFTVPRPDSAATGQMVARVARTQRSNR